MEDRYTEGHNFAKCFGYFATIGNRPPYIYSVCAFTTIHDEWEKKQGRLGLIHHVSGHEVDGRREDSILKYSCTKLQSNLVTRLSPLRKGRAWYIL